VFREVRKKLVAELVMVTHRDYLFYPIFQGARMGVKEQHREFLFYPFFQESNPQAMEEGNSEVAELAVEQHQVIRFYPTFQGLLALLIVVV
jgi:hypothetical protein